MRKTKAFTLVELLVVMAIISILASLLFPALRQAISAGKKVRCLSNLRQLAVATVQYGEDNRRFPYYTSHWANGWGECKKTTTVGYRLYKYEYATAELWACPEVNQSDTSDWRTVQDYNKGYPYPQWFFINYGYPMYLNCGERESWAEFGKCKFPAPGWIKPSHLMYGDAFRHEIHNMNRADPTNPATRFGLNVNRHSDFWNFVRIDCAAQTYSEQRKRDEFSGGWAPKYHYQQWVW